MNTKTDSNEFNFDTWANLAKDNPQAFEQQRKKLVDDFIDNAPIAYQERLQALQTLIDWERTQSDSTMESVTRISQLMLNKLHGELIPALDQVKENTLELCDDIRQHRIQVAIKNQRKNIIPFPLRS